MISGDAGYRLVALMSLRNSHQKSISHDAAWQMITLPSSREGVLSSAHYRVSFIREPSYRPATDYRRRHYRRHYQKVVAPRHAGKPLMLPLASHAAVGSWEAQPSEFIASRGRNNIDNISRRASPSPADNSRVALFGALRGVITHTCHNLVR